MSIPSKVFESLSSRGSSSHTPDESAETTPVDDDTIAEAVREAVAEHERVYHESDGDTTDDDATDGDATDDDAGEAADSSASGRSPVGLLGGAAVLALLGYLARRRRRGPDEDHTNEQRHEEPGRDRDGESTDAADR
jgi:hypothetical protein